MTLDARWGELKVKTLAFDLPADADVKEVTVKAQGGELGNDVRQSKSPITITLREPVILAASDLRPDCQAELGFRPGVAGPRNEPRGKTMTTSCMLNQREHVSMVFQRGAFSTTPT